MIKQNTLNPSLPRFGISLGAFVSPFKALIPSSSMYNGVTLIDLLKFDEESNEYLYEDKNIIIYDGGKPSLKSTSYILFKPVEAFTSVGATLFLMHSLDEVDLLDDLSFRMNFDDYNFSIQGVFVTSDLMDKHLPELISSHSDQNFRVFENYVFIEKINRYELEVAFKGLSRCKPHSLKRMFRTVMY